MKKLDSYEIAHLPTLDAVVNHFKEEEQDFLDICMNLSGSFQRILPTAIILMLMNRTG